MNTDKNITAIIHRIINRRQNSVHEWQVAQAHEQGVREACEALLRWHTDDTPEEYRLLLVQTARTDGSHAVAIAWLCDGQYVLNNTVGWIESGDLRLRTSDIEGWRYIEGI